RATCCARWAAKSSASARGSRSSATPRWCSTIRLISSPSGVPPGSPVSSAATPRERSHSARWRAAVVLPLPSGPSRVMNRPRAPALGISSEGLAPGLALVGEELDTPVRLRPARAAHQVVSLRQLVLQPAHVCVLRRELDRPSGRLHQTNRLRRLAQRRLLWVGTQVIQAGQHV